LKEGLLPAGYKGLPLNFTDEISMGGERATKTFGGVYLSRNLQDTLNLYEGESVIIKVVIETESPGVLLDEDEIHEIFENMNYSRANHIFSYLKKERFNITSIEQARKIVADTDFWDLLYLFKKSFNEKNIPRDFIVDWDKDKKIKDKAILRVIRALTLHILDSNLYSRGLSRGTTYREWKNSVTDLSKILKVTPQSGLNIRFPNPITYRGKNRILGIIKSTYIPEGRRSHFYVIQAVWGKTDDMLPKDDPYILLNSQGKFVEAQNVTKDVEIAMNNYIGEIK
jgi:hypothetical protein